MNEFINAATAGAGVLDVHRGPWDLRSPKHFLILEHFKNRRLMLHKLTWEF